jgi:hypothetical protein
VNSNSKSFICPGKQSFEHLDYDFSDSFHEKVTFLQNKSKKYPAHDFGIKRLPIKAGKMQPLHAYKNKE